MRRFATTNLENLGTEFSIPITAGEDGYLGRECPVQDCLGYFKITPGTGEKGPAPCHCPYCGHAGESRTFFTQEQIEYARSVVLRKVTDAIHKDLKSLEFEHRPQGLFGIGLSLKVERSMPLPIRYYREKQLETAVVCDACTLRYALYGVFGWCPDCGVHNSMQILAKNLELARKELALAATVDPELADRLIGDALNNAVSAFDGFGREICMRRSADIRFQSIAGARRKVQETFAFDFADSLRPDEWECACRVFQKRHLLAHKMGVIDDEYLQKANDASAVLGRKICLTHTEVESAIGIVEAMGRRLYAGVLPTTP
jgi:hypothetical protein